MARYFSNYKAVMTGVSIVDQEAYTDYRHTSKIRNPKVFKSFKDYRRIARKIWNRIAEDSIIYESGVYDREFFYLIPQVIANESFIELPNGKIKTNSHTEGDCYTPIFCNLFKNFNHFCWSVDGMYVRSYKDNMKNIIDRFVPKYYFILPTLVANKL